MFVLSLFIRLFMADYTGKILVLNVVVRELGKTYPSLSKYSALFFLCMVAHLEDHKSPTTIAGVSFALSHNGRKHSFKGYIQVAEPLVLDGLLRRTAHYRYHMTTAGRVALDLFNKYMANATTRIKSKDFAIKGLRGS